MPAVDMTLQERLELSIHQYQETLAEMDQMETGLAALSSEQLVELVQKFSRQQDEAANNDRLLLELLEGAGENSANDSLFRQRVALMQQVQERNRLLSQKIRGIMSVLSTELGQIRSGRTAMAGYGGDRSRKGAVLNQNH